jgi:hypothetical protein
MNETVSAQNPPTSKPPVSERKASANRANAQRSTGPRTAQGKATSSLNALRHGILAKAAFNVTLEGEARRAEFEEMVTGFAQEYQPRTPTEHMMVQQLAGCYWKLAKVWTFETESAWRSNAGNNLGIEDLAQLEKAKFTKVVDEVMEAQDELFPRAGLGNPTIPSGPSARTILRYQGALNAMLFRCINFLERRHKERRQSDESFAEVDYINEATAEAAAASEAEEKPAGAAAPPALPKRTQKAAADAPVSSQGVAKTENPGSVAEESASKTPPKAS